MVEHDRRVGRTNGTVTRWIGSVALVIPLFRVVVPSKILCCCSHALIPIDVAPAGLIP
jgi:hypothetical protein